MKLNTIRKIRFWSLRSSLGCSGGVIFDNDVKVIKKCRLVRVPDGLKWQLVKDAEYENSYCNETDQECLNEHDFEDVEIFNSPMDKYRNNGVRGVRRPTDTDIPF